MSVFAVEYLMLSSYEIYVNFNFTFLIGIPLYKTCLNNLIFDFRGILAYLSL